MKLIIGLGNPGTTYDATRHNVGFRVLEPMGKFILKKKFEALIAHPSPELLLALPQTFMNDSGRAVRAISTFYKITPDSIWIVHDDIDLPLGTVRLSFNRSAGGHRGVDSIFTTLGRQDCWRFRIGIAGRGKKVTATDAYVLKPFGRTEKPLIEHTLTLTRNTIESALRDGITAGTITVS